MKESIAHVLKREGYVAEVAVEGKPHKNLKIKLKYTGRKPSSKARAGSARRACAGIPALWMFRAFAADGRLDPLHLGRNHDRHAGAQEKCRGRIALRNLVGILCLELENYPWPFRPR